MNPPNMVLVTWEDAASIDDGVWTADKDHDKYKPHIWHQVGYLLADMPEGIVITSAWHPELCAARDQIPRAMIRSITLLGPVKAPRKRK